MFENHPQGAQLAKTFAKLNARAYDRRGFLTGAGKLAGAGAVAMALTGTQLSSVFANHAGTETPDTVDGNEDVPTDCYDFDDSGEVNQVDVLQFALFLEHLENAYYAQGVATFTAADFQRGLRAFRKDSLEATGSIFVNGGKVYEDVQRVAEHEAAHAADLSAALAAAGAVPVVACEYDFSAAMVDVEAFLRTAQLLENTGVAAYVGAASCITSPVYIRIAASIATVEARHATYFDAITANTVFPSPYDLARPMAATFDAVASLGVITSCEQPQGAPQPPFASEGGDMNGDETTLDEVQGDDTN